MHINTTKWLHNVPLLLLAGGIALSPSFTAFTIAGESGAGLARAVEIRVEDIVLFFILAYSIFTFFISKRTTLRKPPLLLPLLIWVSMGLFSTLVNLVISGSEEVSSFFFLAKEIEYFLIYFCVFYSIKNQESARFIFKAWVFFTFINFLWVIIQIMTPFRSSGYYYGPTLFSEPSNPFGTGAVFLILSLFFINVLLFDVWRSSRARAKKIFLTLLLFSPVIGLFASGSRAAGVSFIVSLIPLLVLYFIKGRNKVSLRIAASTLIILIGLFVGLIYKMEMEGPGRLLNIGSKIEKELIFDPSKTTGVSRFTIWYQQVQATINSPLATLFGYGKAPFGEAHNQFVRNFVETGIIGSLLFIILLIAILKKTLFHIEHETQPFAVALFTGLMTTTVAMIIISIPAESFIYAIKLSETYWFFAGLTMAVASKNLEPKI